MHLRHPHTQHLTSTHATPSYIHTCNTFLHTHMQHLLTYTHTTPSCIHTHYTSLHLHVTPSCIHTHTFLHPQTLHLLASTHATPSCYTHQCTYTLTYWTHRVKRRSRAKRRWWTKRRSRVKRSRWFGWIPGRPWPKRYAQWKFGFVCKKLYHSWAIAGLHVFDVQIPQLATVFHKYTGSFVWLIISINLLTSLHPPHIQNSEDNRTEFLCKALKNMFI